MNQYLLSVHYVEGEAEPDADTMQQMFQDVSKLNDKLQADGSWVFGCGLHTPDTSTVVSAEKGEVVVTDGPFSEAKEQIGGFWIIKAPDLDAALDVAAQASAACLGPVEVRPLQDDSEDQPQSPEKRS